MRNLESFPTGELGAMVSEALNALIVRGGLPHHLAAAGRYEGLETGPVRVGSRDSAWTIAETIARVLYGGAPGEKEEAP